MTNEQKSEFVANIRNQIQEVLAVAEVGTTTVLDELDNHPELFSNVSELLRKFMSVHTDMINEAAEITVRMRVEAFKNIKNELNLSDELTVKLVTGF